MRVVKELEIEDFYDLKNMCWSGAQYTLNEVEGLGLEDEFVDYVKDSFEGYDEVTDTMVNDFIWFDCDEWVEEHKEEDEEE